MQPQEEQYELWVGPLRLKNPNPYIVLRNLIIYDAVVFGLDVIFNVIALIQSGRNNMAAVIIQLLFGVLIVGGTLYQMRGLELAIRLKILNQKYCCYNCIRIFYHSCIGIMAILNIINGSQYAKLGVYIYIVWGIVILPLAVLGLIFQFTISKLVRRYSSEYQGENPGYGGGMMPFGQPRYMPQAYPQQQQQIVYGQPAGGRPQQPMIPMQEINMQNPGNGTNPNSAANNTSNFHAFQGKGRTIGGGP